MRLSFALIVALLALPVTAAHSQTPADRRMPVHRADVEALARERFSAMDSNHDGFLTADELGDTPPGEIDPDHDGRLSQTETTAALLTLFDFVDADHDGTLTSEERTTANERIGPETPPSNQPPSG